MGLRLGVRACALTVMAALAVGLGACGDDDDEAGGEGKATETITVGYAFGFDVGDTGDRVAFRRIQERESIRTRFREMGGAPNTVTALQKGDIDFASMNLASAITAIDQGADLRVVLGSNMFPEWELVAGPDIATAADLKGKKLATFGRNDETEATVLAGLEEAGLGEDDVELIALGDSPNRATALERGRIDATSLEFVDQQRLKTRIEGLHVLARLRDLAPTVAPTVLVTTGRYLRGNRDVVERVVHGLLDGYDFVYGDEGKAAFVAEARRGPLSEDPPALAAQTYDFYREEGLWPRADEPIDADRMVATQRFWLKTGQLEKSLPFPKIWDVSFWQSAS